MATRIKDGVRVQMTEEEELEMINERASRQKMPRSRNKTDKLQDLLIAKGLMEESERV